jgi:hypothetical protein
MKKFIEFASSAVIILSCSSFFMVGAMAYVDPQKVMDLVQVNLGNNDALSSIRGVYGGVGCSLAFLLLFLLRFNKNMALGFLSMIWGSYALSRIITIFADGPLGSFGTQWMFTEVFLFMASLFLFLVRKRFFGHERNNMVQSSLHSFHEAGKEHHYQGVG